MKNIMKDQNNFQTNSTPQKTIILYGYGYVSVCICVCV